MKNSNKIYSIISVFALGAAALVVFLIWPLFMEIGKNSEELISAKNSIINLDAQTKEISVFKNNYADYAKDLNKIEQLFVDESNPVDFIEFLENTAASSHITSQISLQSGFQKTNQGFIVVQVSSVGSFSDVVDFVEKVETGSYFVEAENLVIQEVQEKNMAKVNAVLTIKAFTKK